MKEINVSKKIAFIFNIIGIFFLTMAMYMPINEAISQFFKTVNIQIDFLILIKPYLLALFGSIMILLSALFISRKFKLTLSFFLIQNVSMILFFGIMIFKDESIRLSDLYFNNNFILYFLYAVYSFGSLVMIVISLLLVFNFDVSLKEWKEQ